MMPRHAFAAAARWRYTHADAFYLLMICFSSSFFFFFFARCCARFFFIFTFFFFFMFFVEVCCLLSFFFMLYVVCYLHYIYLFHFSSFSFMTWLTHTARGGGRWEGVGSGRRSVGCGETPGCLPLTFLPPSPPRHAARLAHAAQHSGAPVLLRWLVVGHHHIRTTRLLPRLHHR